MKLHQGIAALILSSFLFGEVHSFYPSWEQVRASLSEVSVSPEIKQEIQKMAVYGVGSFLYLAALVSFIKYSQRRTAQLVVKAPPAQKILFKDVAGAAQAKDELQDIVDYLKNPEKFKKLGAKPPCGVLLTGDPGNGKTLLAKAVAGEAGVPFFSVSGSEFVEQFVGVGAARVRELFNNARKHSPCIIFIDEIDAVGHRRTDGDNNQERENTLNQLLTELDGFSTEPGKVIVIGATNRIDILDKALIRSGRFDRKVEVPCPDVAAREEILHLYSGAVPLESDVNFAKIAHETAGLSGADLATLVNEALLLALKTGKEKLSMNEFERAKNKVITGLQKGVPHRSPEEIKHAAYFEIARAVVALETPHAPVLYKLALENSNTPVIYWLLQHNKGLRSEAEMKAEIMTCLAGRVVEELVYGENGRTTHAYNYFQKAIAVAKDMVVKYGMSSLGVLAISDQNAVKTHSEATAQKIDDATNSVIDECYQKTRSLLMNKRTALDLLVQTLLDKKVLEAHEVAAIIKKQWVNTNLNKDNNEYV